MNTHTAESIEQIYNFLKEDQFIYSKQQFDKIERLLQELHTQGKDGFLAEKPYKYKFHFNGSHIGLNAGDAPRFAKNEEFLGWLFKKLKVHKTIHSNHFYNEVLCYFPF